MAIREELTLGIQNFQANLDKARADVRKTAGEMSRDMRNSGGWGGSGGDGGGILGGLVGSARFLAPAAAGLAAFRFGVDAISVSMERQRAEMALGAVSTEDVGTQLERLAELAEMPGLGFDQVLAGTTRLQAVGFAAAEAEKTLAELGNALALVGGGKEQMDGIILAIGQIMSKGKVSAEEINQIAERLPQIRVLMKDAFGTADTEVLQSMGVQAEEFLMKITEAAAELPRAAMTSSAAMSNLQDDWKSFMQSVGDTVEPALQGLFEKLSGLLEGAADVVEAIGGIGSFIKDVGDMGVENALLKLEDRALEKLIAAEDSKDAAGVAAEEKSKETEAAKTLKEEAESANEYAEALEQIEKITSGLADKQIDLLPDDEKLTALKSGLDKLLGESVGLFSLNFETSIAGLEKLLAARLENKNLPATGQNSALEAAQWLQEARSLEADIAKTQEKIDSQKDREKTEFEKISYDRMSPEEQARTIRDRLAKSLGVDAVGSSASIEAAARNLAASGDDAGAVAALKDLTELEAIAGRQTGSAGGVAGSVGQGSFATLMDQIFGRGVPEQQLDEIKKSAEAAVDSKAILASILTKMDNPPEKDHFTDSDY